VHYAQMNAINKRKVAAASSSGSPSLGVMATTGASDTVGFDISAALLANSAHSPILPKGSPGSPTSSSVIERRRSVMLLANPLSQPDKDSKLDPFHITKSFESPESKANEDNFSVNRSSASRSPLGYGGVNYKLFSKFAHDFGIVPYLLKEPQLYR